jgi:hypothetical protein
MTYAKGSTVLAADYNAFTGGLDVTSAFASSAAATSTAAGLLGVGYGDRGYGQTSISLPPLVVGQTIIGSAWSNLRSAVALMASHQGTASTLNPPSTEFNIGSSIKAEAIATTAYDFASMLSSVDANRFNTNGGASMTLTASAITIARGTTWGTSGAPNITCTVDVTWATEDAARFFFNSGGEIRLALAHPVTTTTQDANWNSVLAALGTFALKANTFTRSGSSGTPAAIGYYQLTGSTQRAFDGTNIGTGAYTANDVYVDVLYQNYTGTNGAKGRTVRFIITLQDQHSNSFYDQVNAGTNAVFSHLKATAVLSGIATPTFTAVVGF